MSRLLRSLALAAAAALGTVGAVAVTAPAAADDVLTVTNDLPFGGGSFLDRLTIANSDPDHDTIVFDLGLAASWTIVLQAAAPITQPLTIQGPTTKTVTFEGTGAHDLLLFSPATAGQSLTIIDIEFHGTPGNPGAGLRASNLVHNPGPDVTLTDVDFSNLHAGADGGCAALIGVGVVTLTNVDMQDCESDATGGALYVNIATSVTATSSTFLSNEAVNGGGAYLTDIENVTFTGSLVARNFASGSGGGLYLDGVESPKFADTTFQLNEAIRDGGGLYASDTDKPIEFTDTTTFQDNEAFSADPQAPWESRGGGAYIDSNANGVVYEGGLLLRNASEYGGGIYLDGLTPDGTSFTGVRFEGNSASQGADSAGGGLAVSDENEPNAGPLDLIDVEFTANTAPKGGGIALDEVMFDTTIDPSYFINNDATDGEGGAIWVGLIGVGHTFDILETEFTQNSATDGGGTEGGAVYVDTILGDLGIANSTFAQNVLLGGIGFGVSLYVNNIEDGSELEIFQSTFDEGVQAAVGAVAVDDNLGDVEIAASTIVGPTALYISEQDGFAQATSTIFDGLGSSAIDVAPVAVELEYSISSSPLSGAVNNLGKNQFSTNAQLAPLADNGGPTQTRLPSLTGPAIDRGEAFANPFDQRGDGFPRVIGSLQDVGAVEVGRLLAATGSGAPTGALVVALAVLVLGAGALVFSVSVRRRATAR